jgi:hypothetical protein
LSNKSCGSMELGLPQKYVTRSATLIAEGKSRLVILHSEPK